MISKSTKRLAALIFLCAQPSWALDGVSIVGGTNRNADGLKADFFQVAVREGFNGRWLESSTGALTTYWEASLSRWNPDGRENWVGALGVAARYEFSGAPYVEYGLGGAYLSDLHVAKNRRVGSNFQFANRFEVGYRFGRARENELGLAYWHYSNAGIKNPNPGMDFVSVRYTRRF